MAREIKDGVEGTFANDIFAWDEWRRLLIDDIPLVMILNTMP